jgi:hypothetical protein
MQSALYVIGWSAYERIFVVELEELGESGLHEGGG